MIDDNTPILVGGGQLTQKLPFDQADTPVEMMAKAAAAAAANAGITPELLSQIDTIATTELAIDYIGAENLGAESYTNMPACLAHRLGANPDNVFAACAGGNTPQMLINSMASRINRGEVDFTLIAGAENLHCLIDALKKGGKVSVESSPATQAVLLGENRAPANPHECQYQLDMPINTYPLFENAIRGKLGHSIDEHLQFMAALFSPMSRIAADNPHAWFRTYRSPEEIATVNSNNRWIGFPYPKYLNSVITVNMAAAVIMMSAGTARKLGIDESRWVHLNGCADLTDKWHMIERANYHSSPAMQSMAKLAMKMARTQIGDIDYFDLYSCFPSAVEMACDSFGIDFDDPRPFTVTGGLPYFGGPGNNYVMHAVVNMLDKLREQPGSQGLINGNGWFITKHSMGLYSTTAANEHWQGPDMSAAQREIDAQSSPDFSQTPQGDCTIETYTIIHEGVTPQKAIIIGRLIDGTRFLAHTRQDTNLLEDMKKRECLGAKGTVGQEDGVNIFTFS